jgi:hypothetical protein
MPPRTAGGTFLVGRDSFGQNILLNLFGLGLIKSPKTTFLPFFVQSFFIPCFKRKMIGW